MINDALSLLRKELVVYLASHGYGPESNADTLVVVENIGLFESNSNANLDDKIVFTLVNIEEESTLKNVPPIRKNGAAAWYENPPVFLNLYLLVTSCTMPGRSSASGPRQPMPPSACSTAKSASSRHATRPMPL